ncbi:hypothetical protein ASE75_08730 [Sphingomonas sp. Leaf17]|uniref:hypothetical protein n=1 Tax=Sphingomonas sp. Leaf17 TaxID=1735683 RepID=UPI0006F6CFFA|nr:hypothetical protein [Sphingomonas sp. Leaf17]KQM65115.1 hypothetical protein ASE75_08730 [Sphingomonas sp. Leaf17]
MTYDPGAIDAALAAAVGDEPVLIAELHAAFRESAVQALQAMTMAVDADGWRDAAWRLNGLAASFGAADLMTAATEAARGGVNASMLARLRGLVAVL